jgi:hypothetical protein
MIPESTTSIRRKRTLIIAHSADPHVITIKPLKRTTVAPWTQLIDRLRGRHAS